MTEQPTTLERLRSAALWCRDSALGGFGFGLVLAVALSGWAASFIGLHHFGVDHMGLTVTQAWLVPVTFDGAPAGLSIVVMRASTHGRAAIVWRLLIVGFTALSSWINYVHIEDPTGRLVASLMPPAAVILFEGLMSESRAAAQRRLGGLAPRLHPLRWVFDREGTLDIYRRHILGLELPEALRQAATVDARQTICLGRDGVLKLFPPPPLRRQSWAGAEPDGPIGQPVTDLASVLGKSHSPVVYFVRNGSRVKIGTSQNLAGRISSLSLRSTDILLVLHGGNEYEKQIHRRFGAYRVTNTEWFELAGELAEYLAAETGTPVASDPDGSVATSPTTGGVPVDSSIPATGASTTASDRQDDRQEAAPGDTDAASTTAKTTAKKAASTTAKSSTTSDNTRQKPTPGAAKKTASKSTPGASPRRSQTEWVDVAGPIFDRQRAELGRVPSGRQFADAIASEGLGDVSESTAKNIRQWVLQADATPAN